MRHKLRKIDGFWHCTVCQWRWSSRRRTACPEAPRYTLDTLPSYLKTLPQLELLGLKPPNQTPDACYYRRLAPHWLYFYDVRKSLPPKARPLQRLKFEQGWLRQCKKVIGWAQERLHSEQVIILGTETVGPLNDLDLSELAILDMQGRVLLNTRLRHRQWTAALERHFPRTSSSVRPALPPPRLADIWPQVEALFERSNTVIAYNVAFHRDALTQSARRYGLPLPPLHWECLMNNYAVYYGRVRLDEYGRLDERDPFQWQSRVNACKQQRIPWSRSEEAKQHVAKDLAILGALAADAQRWQE